MKSILSSSILVVLAIAGTMISGTQAAPVAVVSSATPDPVESLAVNGTDVEAAFHLPNPSCVLQCIVAHNAGDALCEGIFQGMDLAFCKANMAATFVACKRRC
ncbi:hypothetical protein BGZ47_000752 [Haplosporangium gracile]|nr:hypothetical protein BGZ47_000752 [Haplosporangium gracile]